MTSSCGLASIALLCWLWQVSRACKQEIKRVMKSYALSVELNPEVQAKCLSDLGNFCSSNKGDTAVGAVGSL